MSQGTFTTRVEIQYRTPEEALRLTEDVQALRQAAALLKTVDIRNIADEVTSQDMMFFYIQKLREWERYARRKLATEFLDPRRKRMNAKP